jgi:hypothetical protein
MYRATILWNKRRKAVSLLLYIHEYKAIIWLSIESILLLFVLRVRVIHIYAQLLLYYIIKLLLLLLLFHGYIIIILFYFRIDFAFNEVHTCGLMCILILFIHIYTILAVYYPTSLGINVLKHNTRYYIGVYLDGFNVLFNSLANQHRCTSSLSEPIQPKRAIHPWPIG